MCVWQGTGVKGEMGWRKKDDRERSIQEARHLKFCEPESSIVGKGGGGRIDGWDVLLV